MSDAIDLRVSRSLELLSKLRRTVSDFAKREEQLSQEQQSRRYQAQRKHNLVIHKAETAAAERIAAVEERFKAEAERIRARYDGRLTHVQRVHASALRTLPQRAQDAKGGFLGELQRKERRSEKTLTSGLATADAGFAESKARNEEQRAELAAFDKRTRGSFRGYGAFRKLLAADPGPLPQPGDPLALAGEFRELLAKGGEQLAAFNRFPIPKAFSFVPPPVWIGVVVAACVAMAVRHGVQSSAFGLSAGLGLALLAMLLVLHRLGRAAPEPAATALAATLVRARGVHRSYGPATEAKLESEKKRLQEEFDRTGAELVAQWNRADEVESEFETKSRGKLDTQFPRLSATIEMKLKHESGRMDVEGTARLDELRAAAAGEKRALTDAMDAEMAALRETDREGWEALQAEWMRSIQPIDAAICRMNSATAAAFPDWSTGFVEKWTPPSDFLQATKFARLEVDLNARVEGVPPLAKLAYPAPPVVSIPLSLAYPAQGSVFIEDSESGSGALIGPLNNLILRLLSTTPPGKISFTIIDAVGLGQNFAGLMHLADYEESLINRRIWTQPEQIDERLVELNAHIEKVIQMYLRNEYATITEYNEHAGTVAEKYHFLVVAGFPAGFTDTAAKRLQSIAVSGPRCGVFTLIHWDQRQPLPDGVVQEELRKTSVCLRRAGNEFVVGKEQTEAGAKLVFDKPPEPELALSLIHKIGKSSVDSNRVEVPFFQIAPKPAEMWTGDTTSELRVAVGRTGATKLQYLAIGKGTRQHALFAGKTGSGKSTLFHVIITNLALACSPDQVEFYLIDFKKGVEFKCYASKRLPHARVVAIESDREFALSVLQRVDEELKRRGDIFRKLGVQDLAGYKKAGGIEPMPRSLLLIDEFQEFFVEDDTIAQTASLLFDRIVRQGRAFGIHVLLGSQSLGGAYSLARATLGQMVIRVALQCNEADAYLIMDDSNSAPRLLSRPGEGIYNDAGGAIEGNSPFQVVWLPDDERDEWLDKVSELARQHPHSRPGPIVFEGNAPADIRENELLRAVLAAKPSTPPAAARCWLGAPNSIKGPTEAVFQRQSGNHLLIVGQSDEAALTLLGVSLLALAAQHPAGTARFIFLHTANPGSADAEFIGRILEAIPQTVETPGAHEIPDTMNELATALKARASGDSRTGGAPAIFLFIHGLQKFKKLRQEDEFSFSSGDAGPAPGAQFSDIIAEGSSVGIHILAAVDTFNNVNRSMNRKAQSEFEMRVVFQMSANDSASLIDSPKASNLGMHRAIFYNEQSGLLETFRPYATPDAGWIVHAASQLAGKE